MCYQNTSCFSYIKRLLITILAINIICFLFVSAIGIYVMFKTQQSIDKYKNNFDGNTEDLKIIKTLLYNLGLSLFVANDESNGYLANLKLQSK